MEVKSEEVKSGEVKSDEVKQTTENKVAIFKALFELLLALSEEVLKEGIEKNVNAEKDGVRLDKNIINEKIRGYRKCYTMTSAEDMESNQLGIFKYLWGKYGSSISASLMAGDNSWMIRNNIEIRYGVNLGTPTKIYLNLTDVYIIAINVKQSHEKNMAEFPDVFKPSQVSVFPAQLEKAILKIFNLVSDDPVLKKKVEQGDAGPRSRTSYA